MANKKTVTEPDIAEIAEMPDVVEMPEPLGESAKAGEHAGTTDAETLIYIGASFKGVTTGTVFKGDALTPVLAEAIKKMPAINELLVPVDRLIAARKQLQNKDSAISKFYELSKTYGKGD